MYNIFYNVEYFLGNKNDMIEFQTRCSGSLFVKKCGQEITMELPLNATAKQVHRRKYCRYVQLYIYWYM